MAGKLLHEIVPGVLSDIAGKAFGSFLGELFKADADPASLYVSRPLKNTGDLHAWMKAQGFKNAMPASEMHVTVAYSKTPVKWGEMGDHPDALSFQGGARVVKPLGDKGAVVLGFRAPELQQRHEDMKSKGVSHDFPSYQPHVTLTYDGSDVDLDQVEPYTGKLEFGPEKFAEIDDGWQDGKTEDKLTKRSAARLLFDVLKYSDDEARDSAGRWTAGGGGSPALTSQGDDKNGLGESMVDASDEDLDSHDMMSAVYNDKPGDPASITQWEKDYAARQAAKDVDAPVFKPLNELSSQMAAKRFPQGYDVADDAPNTFEALKEHVAQTGRMSVWSGASGKTIFGDAKANYDFRAWHDACHLAGNHPFTPEGELGAFNDMVEDVHEAADHTPEAAKTISLLHEEIIGQLTYGQNHGGEFPVNQRGFAAAYLADPEKAVKADFSKGRAQHHQPGGPGAWGRFRDVPPGSDIPAMIAAALKKKT